MSDVNESVQVGGAAPTTTTGSAGVQSQIPGQAATVSGLAGATGGIEAGNMVETDIDQELFRFKSDDTPLTQLMLKARRVKVTSPIVDHYMIDEPRSKVVTTEAVEGGKAQAILPLDIADQQLPRPYGTLLVKGVDGYTEDGQSVTPGKDLMLLVTGHDVTSGNPVVRALNGPKTNETDELCKTVAIPSGTTLILLGNACYETQKEVDPDLITPQPTKVYCQKRVMNKVISDYFESQKKHIPYAKALIAEAALTNYKLRGNRTYWSGRKSKITVNTKLGAQMILTCEGVRWQFKKELQHSGKWTFEQLIALAKMAFTGEDVPKYMVLLAGKNFLENIQCIDFSKHPEIQITTKTNKLGWTVSSVHTAFGDFDIKHEATLDRLGWSNSGALIAPDRLVRYVYSAEHSDTERVQGEEASREALINWDAPALKGSCHIWIDGDGEEANADAVSYILWDDSTAPASPVDGAVYYLLNGCPGINAKAQAGQMWQAKVTTSGKGDTATTTTTWTEYRGEISLG